MYYTQSDINIGLNLALNFALPAEVVHLRVDQRLAVNWLFSLMRLSVGCSKARLKPIVSGLS